MLGEISPVPIDARSEAPDWNVTVTLSEPTFRIARKLLSRWGRLRRTEYYNVAVMSVRDMGAFLKEFAAAVEETPGILNAISHVLPFEHVFKFKDAAEFEAKSREIAPVLCSAARRQVIPCETAPARSEGNNFYPWGGAFPR